MTVPHCALKCAVPSVPFGNTVPHCALERAPDQTLRFGWGKHFSLPPTCAIVEIFLFARRSNHQIFSSHTSLSWWKNKTRGEICALEWILVKSEIFARCNSCHDFTAQNLREPWVSQIFVKAASDICCDIEIYGSHWVRPLWNWAPCAGKQLCHITDCFMGSLKQHRNILLALSPLLFRQNTQSTNHNRNTFNHLPLLIQLIRKYLTNILIGWWSQICTFYSRQTSSSPYPKRASA